MRSYPGTSAAPLRPAVAPPEPAPAATLIHVPGVLAPALACNRGANVIGCTIESAGICYKAGV